MIEGTPEVTVIVPVRDGERFIRESLDSLLAQSFRDFVVLVIDDGSLDATREIVHQYSDPRIRLLCNSERSGAAAARNRGLEEAKSPYIAFLDSDDIAEPRRLERQLDCARRRPGVGVVTAPVAVIDGRGMPSGEVWGWHGPDELVGPSMMFRNVVPTSTIFIDRAALRGDCFDATLEVASDYDLWARLVNRAPVVSLSEPLAKYRVHPANLTHQRQAASEACLERIAVRHLAGLGISPSPAQLATHRRVGSRKLEGTRPFLEDVAAWFPRLEAANRTRRMFPLEALEQVIDDEWLAICDAAARGGCWAAWPCIASSPLTRRLLANSGGAAGLAPLPWRTLRGYVRQRWPRFGATARRMMRSRAGTSPRVAIQRSRQ